MEMGFKRQPIRSIGFLFSLLSRMHPTSSGLWSAWSDSNRQGLRRRILSAVCLAISSHADIYLKPTSYLIAISSIGSWMMLSIPIPLLCRTDWPMRPTWHYSAFGAHSRSFKNTIYAYLICLTHVPYIMMAVHLTPFTTAGTGHSKDFHLRSLRSTIIFTFSIIPYLILFVKHYFSYTNNQ